VTTVPFHFEESRRHAERTVVVPAAARIAAGNVGFSGKGAPDASVADGNGGEPSADGVIPIGSVRWRKRVFVEGRVRIMRVQPMAGTATLECVLDDGTGAMSIVFVGRAEIPGIDVGTRLRAQGTAATHHGRLAILNPIYELMPNGSGQDA
jgi:hypothetical protein